jgi:glycosyltransferase involved in cell wall biosynthesis
VDSGQVAVKIAQRPVHERPLRIAYLLQQFPLPTETFAVSDIAALLAQGHKVTVYTVKRLGKREREWLKKCSLPELLLVDRPSWSGARNWPRCLWGWRASASALLRDILRAIPRSPLTAFQSLLCIPRILEIADDIERANTDVAHAFWSRHVGMVLPVLRGAGSRALRSAFVGAYDLVADDFLVDMTLESSEVIFSHAEVNRPYVERKARPGIDTAIVRRGIPLPALTGESQRDPFRWITASSLIPEKNVEAVIRAFSSAHSREPRLTLDVFGQGPDRDRLQGIAEKLGCSDVVTFRGHVRREELFAEMQRASVFLLLSKGEWERLPNVLKEALWAGCAVISSRSEGIEELIPDASIGHVVDPEDLLQIAPALDAVLGQSDSASAERKAKARAYIAENFSTERSMLRYVEAWRARLDRAHAAGTADLERHTVNK